MKATLVIRDKQFLDDRVVVEFRVWRVPIPVRGSSHGFKYSLVLVIENECVLRYDNEAGKGDHRHYGFLETPYEFLSIEKLQDDFWRDVERWLNKKIT